MKTDRADDDVRAALAAAEDETATPAERAEMLMEIASLLQQRPKDVRHLRSAIDLYARALDICPEDECLLLARILARQGTALLALPGESVEPLEAARAGFEAAIPALLDSGRPEEMAEAEMNLGLTLQNLAGRNRAKIADAIAAYHRALRTFDKHRFPKEYAILQNNLATAFLSMPLTDNRARMREALAVQAFEEALRAVNLIDHPSEYAMLQNNLGNALQYSSSSHMIENNLRALDAYDEALKVRTRAAMPAEYANTLANKANCLRNLPDDPQRPDDGNRANLVAARQSYLECRELFTSAGEVEKARLVADACEQIDRELLSAPPARSRGLADSRAQHLN